MRENDKTALSAQIGRLYEVFSVYAPPLHPAFCSHCVSDIEDAVLHTVPLRQLSAEELRRYSLKAISTWGTVEQFKYLLPRLFELVVDEGFGYNPEILFKKPRYGNFVSWPLPEQEALTEYCGALWHYALSHHPLNDFLPQFSSIDECLCSVAQIVDNLHPLLRLLESDATPVTLHLGDFVAENASDLLAGSLSNPFWKERPEQMKQVVGWFSSLDSSALLDLAELGTLPREVAKEVVQAVQRRTKS